METDRHVAMYQSTRLIENAKAAGLIKSMLIDFKNRHLSFNYAINQIILHFKSLIEEDITSREDLKFLIEVFKNGKGNFEKDMSLLVIPILLKPAFDKIEGLDISFNNYVTQLAKRISFSRTIAKFQANDRLFEAIYIIGKFDGYKNLPKFDVRNFKQEPNYYELEKEVFDIAYSESDEAKSEREATTHHGDEKKNILRGNKLFKFQGEYHASMQSEKTFKAIKTDYFHSDTSFEDYLNVFFKKPEEHHSTIHLACKTTLFAKLLHKFKENIALTVNYTRIGDSELFFTFIKRKPLTRHNISNALNASTDLDNENALKTIIEIKKLTKSVKKSNS